MTSLSVKYPFYVSLLALGNTEDDGDSDTERGKSRRPSTRKSFMKRLTSAETKATNKYEEVETDGQRTSNWRHSKINLNNLRSVDSAEIGQGDHAAPTNAAPSSRRSRSHNAFNKFVHQTRDFARRR